MFESVHLPGDRVIIDNEFDALVMLDFDFFKDYDLLPYAPYYQYLSYPLTYKIYHIRSLFTYEDNSLCYVISDDYKRIWIIKERGIIKA